MAKALLSSRLKFSIQPSLRWLLLLCPFILLSPVWLTGKALYWGTPSSQFIPWWWQAWQTILAGEWPLWNPLLGMGAPLLANYQSALFYPPTWIYFGLAALGGLPLMAWVQAFLVGLHLAWAGWGMGRLISRLGSSELAQTVGGLAFSLSGYLVARAHFLSINAAVAWLPWVLLAAYDLAQQPKRKRGLLMLAFFLAMQWLAGHAQIAWYSLWLAAAWTGFWSWRAGYWPQVGRAALGLFAAALLAFALSAVQLFPTAEYLLNSQRAAQVDFAQAATYSFWPWRLITLLAPNFFGNPAYGSYLGYGNFWEDAVYIGLIPLFLSMLALVRFWQARKDRPLFFFLSALVLLAFLFALGANTPLFGWLYDHVPSFALFQAPTRFSIWLVFGLALLAAFGVDIWRAPQGRALYWSRLALAAALAILLQSVIAIGLLAQGAIHGFGIFVWAGLSLGLVAVGAAWLNLNAPSKTGSPPRWAWLVCLLLAADLLYAGWGLNPGADLDLYREEFATPAQSSLGAGRVYLPAEDEYSLKFERLFRFDDFYSADPGAIRTSLLPNTTLLEGIASANNFDPLLPGRYRHWIQALEAAPAGLRDAMLAAMSINVIVRVGPDGSQEQVAFEQKDALPRARWVNCARPVSTAAQALAGTGAAGWSPNDLVLVESTVLVEEVCGLGSSGRVVLLAGSANTVRVQLDSPSGGWLVLADTWYPGWHATVDGVEVPIYPADGLYRAVPLGEGDHEVVFNYRPASFALGLAVSTLAWLGWIILKRSKRELR
ncbi:MAG: YfhO family protein [Anaerolineales bacterium]